MIEAFLASRGIEGQAWLFVTAAAIFTAGVVVAGIVDRVIFPIVLRFTNWTHTDLDARLTRSLRKPVSFGVLLLGAYLAIILPFQLPPHLHVVVERVGRALAIVLGVVALALAVSNVFQWYAAEISHRTEGSLDDRLVPLLSRIAIALVYGLGALLVLDQLEVNISPLIAGLGLGGLAVALALQPTLSNLFAGTYVMTEGVVNPGDYIVLENNMAGYVIDVSWRSTRLRTWTNNLVVVPNSRFAETIITNYAGPAPPVNIYLTCGVSFASDLQWVEQVCREVMGRLLEKDDRAVKEFGAYFAFDSFDDSNVSFWLFIQARDRLASFDLQSELIKELHQRFKQERIVINYPMRTFNYPAPGQDVPFKPRAADGSQFPAAPPLAATQEGHGTERTQNAAMHPDVPDFSLPDAPGL